MPGTVRRFSARFISNLCPESVEISFYSKSVIARLVRATQLAGHGQNKMVRPHEAGDDDCFGQRRTHSKSFSTPNPSSPGLSGRPSLLDTAKNKMGRPQEARDDDCFGRRRTHSKSFSTPNPSSPGLSG